MSIKCEIRHSGGLLKGKDVLYPRVVNAAPIGEAEFEEMVCRNRNLEAAQVKAVLSGVSRTLVSLLSLGHPVYVAGIGSFRLKMKGSLQKDSREVIQLKDASVRCVKMNVSDEIVKGLNDCKFSLISHDTNADGEYDIDQARETALRLLDEQSFFVLSDFCQLTGASKPLGRKMLHALEEESVIIENRRGSYIIWTKGEHAGDQNTDSANTNTSENNDNGD